MIISESELDNILRTAWFNEYGGGKYENVGWHSKNMLQTMMDHKGIRPDPSYKPVPMYTVADDIEAAVRSMESCDMYVQAKCLRCEYFCPNLPVCVKLERLALIGLRMSRTRFFDNISRARFYLLGVLSAAQAA